MTKYASRGAQHVYGDDAKRGPKVYQIWARPEGVEEVARDPSLVVEWDERAAVITTVRTGQGVYKRIAESTRALDVSAVDAFVAAWIEARTEEVGAAWLSMLKVKLDEAHEAEEHAHAVAMEDVSTESHEAWKAAQDAEELALQREAQVARAINELLME